jgi:hypothetical protein
MGSPKKNTPILVDIDGRPWLVDAESGTPTNLDCHLGSITNTRSQHPKPELEYALSRIVRYAHDARLSVAERFKPVSAPATISDNSPFMKLSNRWRSSVVRPKEGNWRN